MVVIALVVVGIPVLIGAFLYGFISQIVRDARAARQSKKARLASAQRPVRRPAPATAPRPASRLAQDTYQHQKMLARHPEARKMTVHFE